MAQLPVIRPGPERELGRQYRLDPAHALFGDASDGRLVDQIAHQAALQIGCGLRGEARCDAADIGQAVTLAASEQEPPDAAERRGGCSHPMIRRVSDWTHLILSQSP